MKTFYKAAWVSLLLLFLPNLFYGQAPNLGTTASFALFTGTGAFNGDAGSTVTGDIGTNTGAHTSPGTLNGAAHWGDAIAVLAASHVLVAYGSFPGGGTVIDVGLGGDTLMSGVYAIGGAATLNGVLTLNGGNNPNAIFVIKIDGALDVSAGSSVSLINEANICNVYFRINGAFSMGAGSSFSGTVVASGAINLGSGASISGRALSTAGAINMNNNTVSLSGVPSPSTITAGGPTTFCSGGSVVLSGNNNGGTWSNGSSMSSITVTSSGGFFVTNSNSCGSSTSNIIAVTVTALPSCAITGNSNICQGQSTELCAPTGASGYLWSTGASTRCITVNQAGTYSVTVTDDGCTNICSRTVTVNPLPACTISGDVSLCQGQTSQLCVPAGSSSYLWSTGATTNCIMVSAAGTYSVTVTNASGCTTTCSSSVTVNPIPSCTISGNEAICAGQTSQLCVPAGAAGYLWSTGATTNCITVGSLGTYSVTVTNADGCTSICSKSVTVNPLPACTISGIDAICAGQTGQLCVPSDGASYLWSTGASTNCITVNAAGTYSVTVTNSSGCTSVCSKTVSLDLAPTASVLSADGPVAFCEQDSVILSGNNGGTWSTGATTPTITVKTSGDYFVTNSNACGMVNSNHILVTVNPLPTASVITANRAVRFCEGDSVVLSGNSGGTWSTGATTPTITVKTSGDYFVTNINACGTVNSNHIAVQVDTLLTVSTISAGGVTTFCEGDSVILSGNNGGIWNTGATTPAITVKTGGDYFVTTSNTCDTLISNHILVTVNLFPLPSVITAGATSICLTDSVVLSGNVGGIWSNGATTPSITVKTAGDYYVTNRTVCDTVISNHIIITVDTLLTAAIINASGSTTFCTGDSLILSGNDGGVWNTGQATASIIVKTSGEYFVLKTNACDSVFSNRITVTVIPELIPGVISANGATVFCEGDSVVLTGNTHGGVWNTGDTATTITVKASGEFFVIDENICDSVTSNRITVTVFTFSSGFAGVNDTICVGESITLGGPSTPGYSYKWSPAYNLSSSTVSNPVATPYYTTKYTLITSIDGLSCLATSSVKITVSPYPSCVIKGNAKICEGQTATLCTASGPGYTYLWSNGDTSRCIEVSVLGRYTVTVTNAMGCSSICGQTVTRGEGPCEITGKTDIYAGNSTQLCATGGYASYLWSTGATTPCINVSAAGTYSVTLTTSNGCVSVCSKTVNVIPLLCEIQIDTICRTLYTLCATEVAGNTYFWPGNGQRTRCITVNCTGDYAVRVTNSNKSSTCNVYINTAVAAPPKKGKWSISGNLYPTQGETTTLCAPYGFTEYHWSTGAKTQCITVNASGSYAVNFSAASGCSGSALAAVHYSSSRRASTVEVLAPVVLPGNVEVRAYPNPFRHSAVFEVQNSESDGHVTIDLCDLTGKRVARVFDADVERGVLYSTVFNAGLLAEGIYFYRYVQGDRMISKKLVLMK